MVVEVFAVDHDPPADGAGALGLCYYRLGLYRDAESQLLSSFKQQPMIFTTLVLAKVWH